MTNDFDIELGSLDVSDTVTAIAPTEEISKESTDAYLNALLDGDDGDGDESLSDFVLRNQTDETSRLVMSLGIDTETGGSTTLDKSITKVAVNNLGSQAEVDIAPEFTIDEKKQLTELITDLMVSFEKQNEPDQSMQDKNELEETRATLRTQYSEKNSIQNAIEEQEVRVEVLTHASMIARKMNSGKRISSKEETYLHENRISLTSIGKELERTIPLLEQNKHKLKEIKKQIEIYEDIRDKLVSKSHAKLSKLQDTTPFESKAKAFVEKSAKIVGVQFGNTLNADDSFKNLTALKCSCGRVNVKTLDYMPAYVGHNLMNLYRTRRQQKKETMNPANLRKRVYIAGINKVDIRGNLIEPIKCDLCDKHLLFQPAIYNKLTNIGFISEETILDAKIDFLRTFLTNSSKVDFYLHSSCVPPSLIQDLGLKEYNGNESLSKISSNPIAGISAKMLNIDYKRDVVFAHTGVLYEEDEKVATEYGNFHNLVETIKEYIDEYLHSKLEKEIRTMRVSKNQSDKNIIKMTSKEKLARYIKNNRWLLINYGVIKRVSGVGIQNVIAIGETDLPKLQLMIRDFTVDYLLDSFIESRDMFEYSGGGIKLIKFEHKNLPMSNFISCYRTLVRQYLIENLKDNAKRDKLSKFGDIFSEMLKTKRGKYNEDSHSSEHSVKHLRKDMEELYVKRGYGEKYEELRNKTFRDYLSRPSTISDNSDLMDNMQAWFIYEHRLTGTPLTHYAYQDGNLYVELYGSES